MAEDETGEHAPEPWIQEDRYIRDAKREIVVRAKSPADARRIVAAVNAVQGIPTDALEGWVVQVVSGSAVGPESDGDTIEEARADALEAIERFLNDRRLEDRRRGDRRPDRRRGDRRRENPDTRVEAG